MARIFQSGFEWQLLAAEFSVPGGGAIDTTIKNGGNASMSTSGSIAAGNFVGTGHGMTMAADVYGRVYIRINTLPADGGTSAAIVDLMTTGGAAQCFSIQMYNNGTNYSMIVYYNGWAASMNGTFALDADTWYRLEFYYKTSGGAGADQIVIKIDGTTIADTGGVTLTNVPAYFQVGVYNGNAAAITSGVNFDDIAINTTAGTVNNSWCGDGKIVIAVPSAAGDNAPTAGTYASVNEIPASNTTTVTTARIDLDTNTTIADFNVTDSATLGIGSTDTINAVSTLIRIREEVAGTTSYKIRVKSASGGTVSETAAADAGNATIRTNPAAATAFARPLISETDPTTGVAWTPTGTNSIDNMQIGVANLAATHIWVLSMCAMIDYTPGDIIPPVVTNGGFFPFFNAN